jgi:hypothetical protein
VELDGKAAVEIVWSETISTPAAHDFEDNSFSKTVLERVVPTSVNGRARLVFSHGRLDYHLIIPETEYEILKRS